MLLLNKFRLLIATLLFSSQTQAKSVCSPHILEDVAEYGTSVEVENVNFNELITQLLKLVEAAELSYFTKIRANFILAKARVCSESGKGLSLKTAKWLQKNGVNAKIYLSLKWINGELLVYDNQSSNALFLHGHEITALLENYKITNIQPADNGELYLEGNTINVFTAENTYVCEASQLLLQNGQAFSKLIQRVYNQIRQIFKVNSVLVNILYPILHKCCNPLGGFIPGVGCLSRYWDNRIRNCFKSWANNLKRKSRQPSNEFLS